MTSMMICQLVSTKRCPQLRPQTFCCTCPQLRPQTFCCTCPQLRPLPTCRFVGPGSAVVPRPRVARVLRLVGHARPHAIRRRTLRGIVRNCGAIIIPPLLLISAPSCPARPLISAPSRPPLPRGILRPPRAASAGARGPSRNCGIRGGRNTTYPEVPPDAFRRINASSDAFWFLCVFACFDIF
jgi:hypothetical protein